MTPNLTGALRMFETALGYMSNAGLLAEVEWQRRLAFEEFTETDLLREAAWVVLCSGFRERVVRRVFDYISLCFCEWESADAIVEADPACRLAALASFGNVAKIDAIALAARLVQSLGFASFKAAILANPLSELQSLPYVGPITVYHLSKNLGLNVAKPDRHLVRVAMRLGFADADHFCTAIAKTTGEQRKVIDLVIWRYLVDRSYMRGSGKLYDVAL